MLGRAAIGYPWIFREIKHYLSTGKKLDPPDLDERIDTVRKHLLFSLEWKGPKQGIFEMRRHYTNYFKGIRNSKSIRTQLVEAITPEEVLGILDQVPKYLESSVVV